MVPKNYRSISIYGEVIGYSSGWHYISTKPRVIVKVGSKTIRIPVDKRQVRFVAKEYPKGSKAELKFDNGWCIQSQIAPSEVSLPVQAQDVFLTSL